VRVLLASCCESETREQRAGNPRAVMDGTLTPLSEQVHPDPTRRLARMERQEDSDGTQSPGSAQRCALECGTVRLRPISAPAKNSGTVNGRDGATLTVEPVGREPGQRPRVSPGRLAGSTVRVGQSELPEAVESNGRHLMAGMPTAVGSAEWESNEAAWARRLPTMRTPAGSSDRLTDREPPSTQRHPILGWPVGVGVQAPVTRAWPVGGWAVLERQSKRAGRGLAAGRVHVKAQRKARWDAHAPSSCGGPRVRTLRPGESGRSSARRLPSPPAIFSSEVTDGSY
jgi:hypothetical protein